MLALCPAMPLKAQQLILPEVELLTSYASESDKLRLSDVEEQAAYSLSSYSAPSPLTLVPKQPMRVQLRLTVLPERSLRGDFLCEVRLIAYRPLYDSDRETAVFVALEESLPLNPSDLNALSGTQGRLPANHFLLRLHYLASLALAAYYDSFDQKGGTEILDYLRANSGLFSSADGTSEVGSGSLAPPMADEIRSEWDTREGSAFRELWFIFHLEVLDAAEEGSSEWDETFLFLLKEWTELARGGHVSALMQMLRDAKTAEIRELYEALPPAKQSKAESYIPALFPTVLSS